VAVFYAWFSHLPQMDFQVYRMGGGHVLGSGLYSSQITVLGRRLPFVYPPLAALFFWPLSHVSVLGGQRIWDATNLVALTALVAVSIAAARSRTLRGSDWRTALVLLAPVAFLLYPVRNDLALGQINIELVLMIVADLTIGVSWRNRHLPRGTLVGIAAAVKLTPLVFIPYLVVSRQWRAARNATLTFALATGAMFVLSPRASWQFFTKDAYDVSKFGNTGVDANQALRAALLRAHLSSSLLFDLVALVVLCAGIALAAMAYRRSSAMLGMLVCAATGLLVSPISWEHHYVWAVPAVIWLAVGADRPARGEWWALGAALAFVVIPPVSAGGSGPLWYLRDDAYVAYTLVFMGLVAVMLRSRAANAGSGRVLQNGGGHGRG
jgi:alpha-1,2-mannosyltransferase